MVSVLVLVLCILHSHVGASVETPTPRYIPGASHANGKWTCNQRFHKLNFVNLPLDNGSCDCDNYCGRSDQLNALGWRGATSMYTNTKKDCKCVETTHPGWCNEIGEMGCDSSCPAYHDYSAADPCTPYLNLCPETHDIRWQEPGSDLYYCMNGAGKVCSINASKPGPDGPGSAWGSVHSLCSHPEHSSLCSSSWPDEATRTVVAMSVVAFVAVVVAVVLCAAAYKCGPKEKRCWESCRKQMREAPEHIDDNIDDKPAGTEASDSLFSYI